tara:strand:+ start:14720 stop:15460 length:741 start_codon:yes stop_codon:yes gene_type:complete
MKSTKLDYMKNLEKSAAYNPRFSNFTGDTAPVRNMDAWNRVYTVVVTNSSNTTGTYAIFGWDAYGAEEAPTTTTVSGLTVQSSFVTVAIQESSHAIVKRDLAGSSFYVASMKLICSDTTQFSNTIGNYFKSTNGAQGAKFITPSTYQPMLLSNTSIIDIPSELINFQIDNMRWLAGSINQNATLTMVLVLSGRTSTGNILNGDSVVSVSTAPVLSNSALQIAAAPQAASSSIPAIKRAAMNSLTRR